MDTVIDASTVPNPFSQLLKNDSSPAYEFLEQLNESEQIQRADLEQQADNSLDAMWNFYAALQEIAERKLYRSTHRTFRDYVNERWGQTTGRFYQIQRFTKVRAAISSLLPDSVECSLPTREAQTRCLAPRTPQEQAEIWQNTVTQFGESPTGAQVEMAMANYDRDNEQASGSKSVQSTLSGGQAAEFESNPNADTAMFNSILGMGGPSVGNQQVQSVPAAKPFKNGQAVVNSKDREIALKAIGELARRCVKLGIWADVRESLDSVMVRIKTLTSDMPDYSLGDLIEDPNDDEAVEIVKPVSRNLF